MFFLITGSPLEALREAACLRRKEGYRPGSRKNLISCQTLFIQFTLVYEVDLQALALDDFGAFAAFLLISGTSPATVINYLSAIKVLFQEWLIADVVRDLSSPAWNLTLRAIYSAGPQPDHRSAVTKDHLLKLVAVCDTDPSLVPLRVVLVFGFLGYLRISPLLQPSPSTPPGTRPGQMSSQERRVSSYTSSGPKPCRLNKASLGSYTATCFLGSPSTVPPHSCSPQLHWSARSSLPPPSGPCCTRLQRPQVCLLNITPPIASGFLFSGQHSP